MMESNGLLMQAIWHKLNEAAVHLEKQADSPDYCVIFPHNLLFRQDKKRKD